MNKRKAATLKFVATLGVVAGLVMAPVRAQDRAQENYDNGPAPSAEAMAVDLVLIRPASLVATFVGTVFFVVALPFSIMGGNTDDAATNLVLKPAKTTFVRPLGEFD